jgi:hypothetical protein
MLLVVVATLVVAALVLVLVLVVLVAMTGARVGAIHLGTPSLLQQALSPSCSHPCFKRV